MSVPAVPAFDPTRFDDSAHGHHALKNTLAGKLGPDSEEEKSQSAFTVTSKDVEAPIKPAEETPEERWARCQLLAQLAWETGVARDLLPAALKAVRYGC